MSWLSDKDAEARRRRKAALAEEAREEERERRLQQGRTGRDRRLSGHRLAGAASAPFVGGTRLEPVLLYQDALAADGTARDRGIAARPRSARRSSRSRPSSARRGSDRRPSSARRASPRRGTAGGAAGRLLAPRRGRERATSSPRPSPFAQPVRVPRPASRARSSALPEPAGARPRARSRSRSRSRSREQSRSRGGGRGEATDQWVVPVGGTPLGLEAPGLANGLEGSTPRSVADRARQLWEAEVAMLAREAAALRGGGRRVPEAGALPAAADDGGGGGGGGSAGGGRSILPHGAAWAAELSPASSVEALSAAWPRSEEAASLSLSAPRRRARVPAARRPAGPGRSDGTASDEAAAVRARLQRLGRIADGLERRKSLRSASTGEAVTAEELMAMVQRAVEGAARQAD